jgi:cytochrome c-type biogenesis protein CcmF
MIGAAIAAPIMPREVRATRRDARSGLRPLRGRSMFFFQTFGYCSIMIAETGLFVLILAFFTAAVAAAMAFAGAKNRSASGMALAARAAYVSAALTGCALAALIALHGISDFSVANVAANSQAGEPLVYKIAGVWSNHEGSMLLWVFLLALTGAAFAAFSRSPSIPLRVRAQGVQSAVLAAFLLYVLLASNPFARLDPAPVNGDGLNPLLMDPALAVHPPFLYLGYTGFSAVFALAVAALMRGRADADWAGAARRWTLFAWSMLTIGIGLGAWWSYYTLGWGGWWAWDPVENAALLPWLAGAALLHALTICEKRGAAAGWAIFLAIAAFSLSLTGTFLVRSGIVNSVHAFASDPTRGAFILILLALVEGGALVLFALRARDVRGAAPIAPISREGGLLAGSMLMALAAAVVLAGTLYPLALGALGLGNAAVGPGYFNRLFAVLAVPLVLLMIAGPLLPWRRGTWRDVFGAANLKAVVRRPAMMLSHLGVAVLIAAAVAAAALQQEKSVVLHPGETVRLAGYDIRLDRLQTVPGAGYTALRADLSVARNGHAAGFLHPEFQVFDNPPLAKAETAIRTNPIGDLMAVPGEPDGNGGMTLHLYRNPLMPWVFVGMALMAAGGLAALWRRKTSRAAAEPGAAKPAFRVAYVLPLAGFAALAVLFAARLVQSGPPPDESAMIAMAKPLPAFDLPPLFEGKPGLTSADLKGKVTVVNFFASWCAPCRLEAPALHDLSGHGIALYGIAYKDKVEPARAMLGELGNPYAATAMDRTGEVAAAFGVTGVPETYVIDGRGTIRLRHAGPLTEKIVEEKILPLARRLQ